MSKKTKAVKKSHTKAKAKAKSRKIKVSRTRNKVTVTVKPTDHVTVTVHPNIKQSTIVSLLLDESGSMGSCLDSTIEGFNQYVAELRKKNSKDVNFTFTKFEGNNVRVVHNNTPINDVLGLTRQTFQPCGSTPLFDAIGKTIQATELALKNRTDSPAVLFVIMTDGGENSSREFNKDAVTKLIDRKKAEGWDFIYLSANLSAVADATSIGLSLGNTVHYSVNNNHDVFASLGQVTTAYSSTRSMGLGASLNRESLIPKNVRVVMEAGNGDEQTGQVTAQTDGTLSSK